MSIELVMIPNHLILCHSLLLLLSIFPSIRVFSNELALYIRWLKYWSFSFSISTFSEYSGLISFSIDWFDLLAPSKELSLLLPRNSQESSPLPQSESISSSVLSLLYDPTLKSICNYYEKKT